MRKVPANSRWQNLAVRIVLKGDRSGGSAEHPRVEGPNGGKLGGKGLCWVGLGGGGVFGGGGGGGWWGGVGVFVFFGFGLWVGGGVCVRQKKGETQWEWVVTRTKKCCKRAIREKNVPKLKKGLNKTRET